MRGCSGTRKLRQYLGYASGDVANNLTFSMASAFLLIYYTDVAGLSAAAAGGRGAAPGVDAVGGEQAWHFADFATGPGVMRVDGNKKGVFTRDRRPKAAAHALRRRWR